MTSTATAQWSKDPDDVLDYEIDWSQWLAPAETISTSIWLVPADITKNSDTHDDTTVTIWLSGGTDGQNYLLTNRITTSGGRTVDRTKRVFVRQR